MARLIVRADDLGLSEGVNYGILKTIKDGIINNVGLMVNMESAYHGYSLIKNTDVCIGLHTNISSGFPISVPSHISSLVNEDGKFKSSIQYRGKGVNIIDINDAIIEIEAQIMRFMDIVGRKPDYIDAHSVDNANFSYAIKVMSQKYDIIFSELSFDDKPVQVGIHKGYLSILCENASVNLENQFLEIAKFPHEGAYDIIVFHPGYLDYTIFQLSSLTFPRIKQVDAACSQKIKEFIEQNNIHLYTYRDLK